MFKKLGLLWLIGVVMLGLGYVNLAVYPFGTTSPNYSDVERVFNKMRFPSDWTEIRSSENKGVAGRNCPIESGSVCYHKSKTFKVPKSTASLDVENKLKESGCPVVAVSESKPAGGVSYTTFKCSIEGLEVSGEIEYMNEPEVYISVRS